MIIAIEIAATATDPAHYVASAGFTTDASATPPWQYFDGRIAGEIELNQQLGSTVLPRKRSVSSWGKITASNVDNALAGWQYESWDGRKIIIRSGTDPAQYSLWTIVFAGQTDGIEISSGNVLLSLRDKSRLLDVLLPRDTIPDVNTGLGVNPVSIGLLSNITPVLIDANNLDYTAGHAQGVLSAVYDQGIALDQGLVAGNDAPGSGDWDATGDSSGIRGFHLNIQPAGMLTCDIGQDISQSLDLGNHWNAVVKMVNLWDGVAGPLTSADISQELLDNINGGNDIQLPAVQQMFPSQDRYQLFVDRPTPLSDLIDMHVAGVSGAWWMDQSGLLFARRIVDPGSVASVAVVDDSVIGGSVSASYAGIKNAVTRLGVRTNFTVQSDSDVAGAVSIVDRARLSREFSIVESGTASDAGAVPDSIPTTLSSISTGQLEVDYMHSLVGTQRWTMRVPLTTLSPANIADVITVESDTQDVIGIGTVKDAAGLTITNELGQPAIGGRNFLVTGIRSQLIAGIAELELWG